MIIRFEGKSFELAPGESVLECLERQGEVVPSFCRSGVCQTCLLKARAGQLPAAAQAGIRPSLRPQGYFLSCVCRPEVDLDVVRADAAVEFEARVTRVQALSDDVLRVLVSRPEGFEFRAGQFVQLVRREDGLMRPYSIASLPGQAYLELHVARLPKGQMSGWLSGAEGADVTLRGPFGDCCYVDGELERPLLLAGTGTGLAPLLGVLRAALAARHRGPIRLYHGSPTPAGLYFWRELQPLLGEAPGLSVVGSVLSAEAGAADELGPASARAMVRVQPLDKAVLGDAPSFDQHRVFLCGHPDLVRLLKKRVYLAGAALERIHADPFVFPS